MSLITETLTLLKHLLHNSTHAAPIKTQQEYKKTLRWMVMVCVLSVLFCAVSLLATSIFSETSSFAAYLASIYISLGIVYVFSSDVIRIIWSWGWHGFQVGKNVTVVDYTVKNTYNDNYEITGRASNKGCLYGLITIFVVFTLFSPFCLYIGPILNAIKLCRSILAIKEYSSANV